MNFSRIIEETEGMTRFILLRHGQSIGNSLGLYLGHTDLDLSEVGYEQAKICADYLKDFNVDAIYSSDLQRAYNTAKPHAEFRGMDIISRSELREIFLGEWEGAKMEDLLLKDYFVKVWKGEFGTCEVPGGERVVDLAIRIYNELYRIACENSGKTILVASHGAAIRSLYARVSGILPQNVGRELPFPTNASISVISFNGKRFIPHIYSFDEYIQDNNMTIV